MRGNKLTRQILGVLTLAAATAGSFSVPAAVAQERSILEEITVTAQRREENLQEVPISVTAVSAERLDSMFEGGEDIRAIANRVPSLYAESSNGRLAPRFYMRGLGNDDFDLAASQSVSIIVDEVVQENVILKSFPLFDVARMEVLRGPQGTLFGRNTPAGIVKFDTRKPSDEFNGYVRATVAGMGTANLEGALGGSLNDSRTLKARVSILRQERDDWIDNGFTGQNSAMGGFSEFAWRTQLEWEATDDLSALVNLHGRNYEGTASVFRANVLTTGSNDLNQNYDRDTVFYDEGSNNPQQADAFGGSLTINYSLNQSMTLTSITAHEQVNNFSLGDIDGGNGADFLPAVGPCQPTSSSRPCIPFPSQTQDGIDNLDQFTQEIRIANDGDGYFWQAGFFYFDSEFAVTTTPFFVPPTTVVHSNEAFALFGQLSYDINDRFTMTGGLRFTDDEKELQAFNSPIPVAPVSVSDEQVSWDLSGLYTVNDTVNLFVRIADGFRAPTIQGRDIAFFGQPSIAKSETILSVEAGIKATLADDRVRINGSIYSYTVDDMQLTAVGGAMNSIQLVNAKEGKGSGFDVDVEWLLTEDLLLGFGLGYNDTEINDPNLLVAPCGSGQCTVLDPDPTPADGNNFVLVDGNRFPKAPEWLGNIVLQYNNDLGGGDEFFVNLDYAYQGETQILLYEAVEFETDSQFELGARIGFSRNDGQWELAAFARNLTDEENLKGVIDFNNNTGFDNEPRIVGVSFSMNFGD
ncbi:MAG: TonB-dependent receptor [Woeseia sp.]|nr:TonB-dependent receptor [Woeseia sp.]